MNFPQCGYINFTMEGKNPQGWFLAVIKTSTGSLTFDAGLPGSSLNYVISDSTSLKCTSWGAKGYGLSIWDLHSRGKPGRSSGFLALTQTNLNCCGHLWTEPEDMRALSVFAK